MRYLASFLLIITTTLCKGQTVLLLDSISLKPIYNVRVYYDKIVYYSDKEGQVTIENFNGKNAYVIHPSYQSKEIRSKDTVLLKPAHFILPELEIFANNKPEILINKRNRNWRLEKCGMMSGSIYGVSIDLNQRLLIKEARIYFKKSLKERIYCRLVIFNTADTLSQKPTPIFGASTFETIPKDTKKYILDIANFPLNNSLDTNYLIAVEFKFDKSLWEESWPSLELWETSILNFYFFSPNSTLIRKKNYFSELAPKMPLATVGIEVIATKLD